MSKKALSLAAKGGLLFGALLVIATAFFLPKLVQPNARTVLADTPDEPSLLSVKKSEVPEKATFQHSASDLTEAPDTEAPEEATFRPSASDIAEAPETETPEEATFQPGDSNLTEAPETEIPEEATFQPSANDLTAAPDTEAPEEATSQPSANDLTEAPETEAHEEATSQPSASDLTEAPDTEVPEEATFQHSASDLAEAPETETPEEATSQPSDSALTEAPDTEVPESNAPESNAPTETTSTAQKRYDERASISEADFAFSLGQKLIAAYNDPDKSFFYSPISVWLPLAALTNAADDRDKPALLEALGVKNATPKELNDYAENMLSYLEIDNSDSPLKIANALFVASGKTVKKEFRSIFEYGFHGKVFNLDFASPKAIDEVNDWASEHTGGLLPRVVESDSFGKSTAVNLLNAVYFSDKWDMAFDTELTRPRPFHAASGDVTANFMQQESDDQYYFVDRRIQAISLSYAGGARMWIMLPKNETANDFLESLTASHFEDIKRNGRERAGTLLLPRFEANIDIDLRDALKGIGVSIFDTELSLVESNSVAISSAKQKAVIKVDEDGTTAAAVTYFAMDGATSDFQGVEWFEMVCDKPFAFVLERYGQILFMGAVNNVQE